MIRRLSYTLLLLTPLCAGADTLDELMTEIMSNNLSAKIETTRAGANVENILGENTLEAPEVEFSRVWGTTREAGDKWSLSVSQSFDWPGIYAARREAAAKARIASQYNIESTMIDLRQEVRTLLTDIIHNAQLLEMQRELTKRMDEMEVYYRKAADAGAETRLDYNKTVLERIATHRELHTLEAERMSLLSSLRALNGGKEIKDLDRRLGSLYPITAIPDETTIAETIRERDPQYAAALAEMEAAKSMVKVEKRKRIPGFSIGYEHEVEGDETFNGFSLGLTLPVWGRKHQIKASTLEADATLLDAEMALIRRTAEMQGDYNQLKSLRTVIDEYEPVINNDANLKLLHKALVGGQINFLTYIQEMNYFVSARRDYIDALYEYNLVLVRLSRYN